MVYHLVALCDDGGVHTVIIAPVPKSGKKAQNTTKNNSNNADDTAHPASGEHPTGFRMQLLLVED